jgi:multiphosphoryl transfer protein
MSQRAGASLEFAFVCSLPSGLHARPASSLAEAATPFVSECLLINQRTGFVASLKSVLAIISADVRAGDRCTVQIQGSDEQQAYAALFHFVERVLPTCDVAIPNSGATSTEPVIPRVLASAGIDFCFGSPVGQGIGQGKVVLLHGMALFKEWTDTRPAVPEHELESIRNAMAAVRGRIREKLNHASSRTEAEILQADLAIANDTSFANKLTDNVSEGLSAGRSVVQTGEFFINLLRKSESEYIRERALDVEEICLQLLEQIHGRNLPLDGIPLIEPSVVVVESLAPQQLLGLDQRWLKALVLEYSGATSHAVILARSLGIPTVVGVKNARKMLDPGQEVIVDAIRGLIATEIKPSVRKFYEREQRTLSRRHNSLLPHANGTVITTDGRSIKVAANSASSKELSVAFENGADGIGLFRTEAIFLGRDRAPSEEEQYALYAGAVRAAGGLPVTIRTFDLGGDKVASYLNLPAETNPFLGYRGVRLYSEYRQLLDTQLRAILRASALGPLRIMAPMICCLEEVLHFKTQITETKRNLSNEGIAFDSGIPIGMMVEVPSVAYILDQLSTEVDFFSLGTNDLNQYFLAADRDNPRTESLTNVLHPSFLRFLKQIVDQVHLGGKWIGMCGQMAAEVAYLPLLLGLGLDEISVPPTKVPDIKKAISRWSAIDGEQLMTCALACQQRGQVEALLNQAQPQQPSERLLSEELVLLDSESLNKQEAIQEIVDAFYVAGRTDDRQRFEQALWSREEVYSTGLGFGFAAPHCKTEAVSADSIAVLKLKGKIDWGSIDGQPVKMIILIAMRDTQSGSRHMQVFSKLARKLMNEEFREHLLAIEERRQMTHYLAQELEIA